MKTMPCDLCTKEFSAASFDEWFGHMKAHYLSDHADFMAQSASKSKEEGMQWMADMKAKFEAL